MTINTTFSAILNTPINVKKKNAEGKYDVIVTTALQDNFAHCPNPKDCTDPSAKSALTNLVKVYEAMETASTSRTDNQRDKAVGRAYEFAKEYLRLVGLSAGVGNVAMITALFAPKRQTKTDRNTKEKSVVGGYTTKSTFIKYALYLTNHVLEGGNWCDVKATNKAKKDENAELWAQMAANKAAFEEQRRRLEAMEKIFAKNPDLQSELDMAIAG